MPNLWLDRRLILKPSAAFRQRLQRHKAAMLEREARSIMRGMARYFDAALDQILRGIYEHILGKAKKKKPTNGPANPRVTYTASVFDTAQFSDGMAGVASKALADIYAKNLQPGQDAAIRLALESYDKRRFIAEHAEDVRRVWEKIGKKTAAKLNGAIYDGIEQGRSYEQIVEGVTDQIKNLKTNAIRNIVKTQVGEAYESARHDFWETAGEGIKKTKEWSPSIGGLNDRTWHNEIPDKGPVPFDGYFLSEPPDLHPSFLRYPNDGDAPIWEILGCTCTYAIDFVGVEAVKKRDEGAFERALLAEWGS